MHAGGGSFTPGQGLSWELFSKALALYAPVILSKKVLISTQALCIMAVYSMSVEGFRYETLFITEAARSAVLMGKTGIQNPEDELARRRTFWIIYCLEKELSFHTTTASLIYDEEVCCLLPPPAQVLSDGLDWIRTWAGLCRIMSRAYTSLFSPGSRTRSEEECLVEIKSIEADTEAWKQSMPESLRPGEPLQRFHFSQSSTRAIALRIHLLYHGFISSLARYTLHTCRNGASERLADARWSLMVAARSTVSLTQYIPQEPLTSMILLYHMPIAAMFILFDFVVYNPGHVETKKNLSFLDIAAGYFASHGKDGDRAENLGHDSARQHMTSTWNDNHRPACEGAGAAMQTPDTLGNAPGTPLSGRVPGLPFQPPHTEDEAMLDMDISAELDFPIDQSLLAFDLYAWNYNPSGTAGI
ncbi:hypothetical protein CEP52_006795 [Fusarium oligoseptatum]|uniref:Xylanolytic transcriptional activator regulatory domain-containing protein n=1 Tax=Fusarium oligoseptatum TaxID=2604345 RepID=A0A428TR29_9HYPO|nr:hypothetical protein CEP52_006795 [Fusarium oligoseptatum]